MFPWTEMGGKIGRLITHNCDADSQHLMELGSSGRSFMGKTLVDLKKRKDDAWNALTPTTLRGASPLVCPKPSGPARNTLDFVFQPVRRQLDFPDDSLRKREVFLDVDSPRMGIWCVVPHMKSSRIGYIWPVGEKGEKEVI